MKIVSTMKAPKPIGPYSQGIIAGDFLFISGQVPIDPQTGKLIKDDFKKAVRTVINNIKAIVEAAGGSLRNIIKVTVYLKDMNKFKEFNDVYSEYFIEPFPTRVVVEVSNIPANSELEIEAIAFLKK